MYLGFWIFEIGFVEQKLCRISLLPEINMIPKCANFDPYFDRHENLKWAVCLPGTFGHPISSCFFSYIHKSSMWAKRLGCTVFLVAVKRRKMIFFVWNRSLALEFQKTLQIPQKHSCWWFSWKILTNKYIIDRKTT